MVLTIHKQSFSPVVIFRDSNELKWHVVVGTKDPIIIGKSEQRLKMCLRSEDLIRELTHLGIHKISRISLGLIH